MNVTNTMRLQRLAVNDEGFAFDPQSGESFTINQTGREILSQMVRGDSFEVIAIDLSDQYQVEKRSVTSDLQDYIQQLRSLGLVEVNV